QRHVCWEKMLAIMGVTAAGSALVVVGMWWPDFGGGSTLGQSGFPGDTGPAANTPAIMHPMVELMKPITAAVIDMLVTIVHRQYRNERLANPMMDQAQVLLCISGA